MGFHLVYCMTLSNKVVFKGASYTLTFDASKSAVSNFPIISEDTWAHGLGVTLFCHTLIIILI